MKEPQKSKIIALLMDYSAGVYQNKEMPNLIESILSPLPHQDGASAEDVLNGCLKESGERMPDWEKEICIKAIHQFAKSEVDKAVAVKDREIAEQKEIAQEWRSNGVTLNHDVFRLQSELSAANERVRELEDASIINEVFKTQ